jgi:hypothetical protein
VKYVMLETHEGEKLPILFPDSLVHADVVAVMTVVLQQRRKTGVEAVSAGFVSIDGDVQVHGESESTGLKSNATDALRIMAGDSIAFSPDVMLSKLAEMMAERKKG